MVTLDEAVTVWRQVKRVLAIGVFGGGAYLLWQLSTGGLQGPVMWLLGAMLTAIGCVGVLFPSKVKVLRGTGGHPD